MLKHIEGYDKDYFMEMVKDWKVDNSPEMDDLEIDEIVWEEGRGWVASVIDAECKSYSLCDDGTGNIVIY